MGGPVNAPDGCQLLLISIQLEVSVGLSTLIHELRSDLRADPTALDRLMKNINEVGWTEDMRHSADLLRFEPHDARIYPC